MAGIHAETLPSFSSPGNVDDLSPQNRAGWSALMSGWIDLEIQRGTGSGSPLTQFFNGTVTAYNQNQAGATITWTGFPNKVRPFYILQLVIDITKIAIAEGDDDVRRWRAADATRDVQDEYLEWSLIRNNAGNIIRVVFTCEGPEYWNFFAAKERDGAVEKIKSLNQPLLDDVPKSSFFWPNQSDPSNESKWVYNPGNQYNNSTASGTITHLVQGANTLRAEINIAAQATILRKTASGNPVSNSDQLIRCSGFGDPDRNSDPRIGYGINQLASQGNAVSLKDPVAIYITDLDTGTLKLDRYGDTSRLEDIPEGTFTFQRGDITKQQGLRLRVQIPDGEKAPDGRQLTVSDIYDTKTQRHIGFGAQIADYIKVGVHGVVIGGVQVAPREFCPSFDTANTSFTDMVPQLKAAIAKQASPHNRVTDLNMPRAIGKKADSGHE
ncbi:uncharacterized protein Z519_11760 [Cladophialophora bantiana CBS 173.52]|uniref:Uncharacterized protein n=1 Tax=Cladophialophora bantiana (strain ATCC 10958 / CBS 173.52 / CDC B-1940 / NIH 8579) TaxID=1442370 RepID=A0A0D2ECC7_CLAB1|nr:uncharacterized protein Z519_11760 [Cladophialophora bantiana CBS 173.52]KIW87786.1 hypothetical protein Z519_11760 [Cladophialophora bantiana CBS 173.52]